ncbi:redoxin domain-containing protein [Pedobacter sp. ASV28]|uniref:redoxin domain-containing protein n=1 Tax=Pedobacter sp. ASV28 TaxID=2795123 RepID=UPI0018EAC094|nr:redoxin domain-containing protein [Pedobacter sp. ASV28]
MHKFSLLIFLIVLSGAPKAQEVLKVGETFSNLALKSTNDQIYDLNAQTKAKGFILIFMTPSCDHCRAYESRIMSLDKQYKTKGYPVVAIGPYGDNEKDYPYDAMPEMKKMALKNGFTFPYVADEKFKYTWLFGIRQTPKAVVLKKLPNGYQVMYIGNIDDQPTENVEPKQKYVEEMVNKLLSSTVHK